jgi:formylglycine-generating enzyme required for sulfatase activity
MPATRHAAWCLLGFVCGLPAQGQLDPQTGLDMRLIDAAGNIGDSSAAGLGAVGDAFRMGTFEVTNTEYVAFLEAVAVDDTHALYDELMSDSDRGGILRGGAPGSWTYSLKTDFADKPANGFDWYSAARFCNWLHNGQPSGAQGPLTTEDGVYDMSLPGGQIGRKVGATWFIPTMDEWHKAAYYDPFDPGADASGSLDYWRYPTRSDSLPIKASADASGDVTNPGFNVANSDKGADWNGENGNVTTVGGCNAPSPWGTFDMGGNVNEITETVGTPITGPPQLPTRRLRGGDFSNAEVLMGSAVPLSGSLNMEALGANIGMRVASHAAWLDLGGALAGAGGTPTLVGSGMTTAGTVVTLELANAATNSNAYLVLGLSELSAPFKGGTLVPAADVIVPGLPTGAAGGFSIPISWPVGLPSATELWFQLWIEDGGAPAGLAATNGVVARTP